MNLGAIICWLLRKHHWRRLRKAERVRLYELAMATSGHQGMDIELAKRQRVCSRCGTRIAIRRAAKP